MPRRHILGEGSIFHITWQCHNKSWLLKHRWAKELLYSLLLKFQARYEVIFYSYIIMDNHIHLAGKAPALVKLSAFFQVVNSLFAKAINKRKKRFGQVVRDRFKSPRLQDEEALMQEMVYHDLNEVRAGKANDPKENELSSYGHYAFGWHDPLITEPDFYIKLGNTPEERQIAYRALVMEILVKAPRKKNGRYTTQLYIGDPLWVKAKYEELKALRQELRANSNTSHAPPLSRPA